MAQYKLNLNKAEVGFLKKLVDGWLDDRPYLGPAGPNCGVFGKLDNLGPEAETVQTMTKDKLLKDLTKLELIHEADRLVDEESLNTNGDARDRLNKVYLELYRRELG